MRRAVLMAADLLWAFIDSKCVVNDEIFQKLSSKITRLSDCLNSLSMSRTYINETRTVLDKQLNKVYESVLNTELQMRQIIGSISKTLSGGSVAGGADSVAQINIPDPTFDALHEVITAHFSTSLLATDEMHIELVNSILGDYFKDSTWSGTIVNFDIVVGKKEVSIIHYGEDETKQTLITLGLLKTRTDLSFVPSYVPDIMDVPGSASYSSGVVSFALDKKSTENGSLENIKTFIEYLEQKEMLILTGYVSLEEEN